MVKFILIKSPDEWATTKQACRDELVVYLLFSPIYIYIFLVNYLKTRSHCDRKATSRLNELLLGNLRTNR